MRPYVTYIKPKESSDEVGGVMVEYAKYILIHTSSEQWLALGALFAVLVGIRWSYLYWLCGKLSLCTKAWKNQRQRWER